MKTYFYIILLLSLYYQILLASNIDNLVSEDFIQKQKNLTKVLKLKNNIPVVYRQMENTDVLSLAFVFKHGLKDIPYESHEGLQLMFNIMPKATKKYSKDKIKELTEYYYTDIDCTAYVDFSFCQMNTINDFFNPMFDIFASVIKEPNFLQDEFNVKKEQMLYSMKSDLENPNTIVSELAASLFYPPKHPYYKSTKQSIDDLKKVKFKDMQLLYKSLINSKDFFIVVVSSLDEKSVIDILNKEFFKLNYKPKNNKADVARLSSAPFNPDKSIIYEYKELPATYVLMYFDAPSYTYPSKRAFEFSIKIFNEYLWENVRTNKNLVYAIYSYIDSYADMGRGAIYFSSSKWKEALDETYKTIDMIKTTNFSPQEFDEYKVSYVTAFFSRLESSSSLIYALINNFYYLGYFEFYDIPVIIKNLTLEQVKKEFNTYVKNFRIGVLTSKTTKEDIQEKK